MFKFFLVHILESFHSKPNHPLPCTRWQQRVCQMRPRGCWKERTHPETHRSLENFGQDFGADSVCTHMPLQAVAKADTVSQRGYCAAQRNDLAHADLTCVKSDRTLARREMLSGNHILRVCASVPTSVPTFSHFVTVNKFSLSLSLSLSLPDLTRHHSVVDGQSSSLLRL